MLERTTGRGAGVVWRPRQVLRCVAIALLPAGVAPAGAPANDLCENAQAVSNGTTPFTNVGADTDGPFVCDMGADVWFTYQADATGPLSVSLCNSDYDTSLAIYEGCACPAGEPLACNDDFCFARSKIIMDVVEGTCYQIQVGGFDGDQGSGTILITKDEGCPGAGGDCFEINGTPGCDDVACCEKVCQAIPICCDTGWDQICRNFALKLCTACNGGEGNCGVANPTPGCQIQDCCELVCDLDPACCDVAWDQTCGDAAQAQCDLCPGDANADGKVDVTDLTLIIIQWFTPGTEGDVNFDGIVNVGDISHTILNWAPLGCE